MYALPQKRGSLANSIADPPDEILPSIERTMHGHGLDSGWHQLHETLGAFRGCGVRVKSTFHQGNGATEIGVNAKLPASRVEIMSILCHLMWRGIGHFSAARTACQGDGGHQQ